MFDVYVQLPILFTHLYCILNWPHPLQKCTTNIRRQSTSKVCCRDPNFKSEEEDYDDFGNMDYMDFDQVYTYNMKPYMENEYEKIR